MVCLLLNITETRNIQRKAAENVGRIFSEQERLSHEFESKREQIKQRTRELNKSEAFNGRERLKLDEEKQKVIVVILIEMLYCCICLHNCKFLFALEIAIWLLPYVKHSKRSSVKPLNLLSSVKKTIEPFKTFSSFFQKYLFS